MLCATALALAAGCASPLQTERTADLHRSVVEAARRELAPLTPSPGNPGDPGPHPVTRTASELTFPPDRLKELEEMAGPSAPAPAEPQTGPDLINQTQPGFRISLQQAVASAVRSNLDVQIAQLEPAISASQLAAAEAAFDWLFFTNFNWQNIDEPAFRQIYSGFVQGGGANIAQSVQYETGLRKPLTTGGQLTVSQGQTYTDQHSPGYVQLPNPANAAQVSVGLEQPLLRGFGSDVTTSQIRLSRNAERGAAQDLKGRLIQTVTATERAYWELVRAKHVLEISQRSLARGIETRDVLKGRLSFDVKPAEYSDAVANVERRRANVTRAVNSLRQASDKLKQLINDAGLSIGSETLLVPSDDTMDQPVTYGLLDSISTALANRPEVQHALLQIDDAAIRQQVADNQRLPKLDLAMRAQYHGLDQSVGDAYQQVNEGQFVDYIIGATFEQPIGNRAAEAGYRERQLERMRSVIVYRKVAQQVVLEVKTAVRNATTSYQLIEQSRSSRLAAAENLRTLLVLEKTTQALTPDFLDLKFRRQDSMAVAEVEEVQALADYQSALAELAGATGTALERNRIKFEIPDAPDESKPGKSGR